MAHLFTFPTYEVNDKTTITCAVGKEGLLRIHLLPDSWDGMVLEGTMMALANLADMMSYSITNYDSNILLRKMN